MKDQHETRKLIAKYLLENTPEGCAEDIIRELTLRSTSPAPSDFFADTFALNYSREDGALQASLSVRLEPSRVPNSDKEDDAGNRGYIFHIHVVVGWPSYGTSVTPGLALRRIGLMSEVAKFAYEIKYAFSDPVFYISSTTASRATEKAENLSVAAKRTLSDWVYASAKGMRVSGTKTATNPGVDLGIEELEIGKHSYSLAVYAESVELTRVA